MGSLAKGDGLATQFRIVMLFRGRLEGVHVDAYGRVQQEGEVVHLIAHRFTNLSPERARVGEYRGPFPLPQGRAE